HVLVVLVAETDVHREVFANPPVVLRKQMEPVRAAVFVASSNAGHCGGRIPEQEIAESVAGDVAGVGKRPARVVGLLGQELQVKEIPADLDAMAASVEQKVVV